MQNDPVTSGEGCLRQAEPQKETELKQLFKQKTQVYAKPKGEVYGLTPAQCWKVKGEEVETSRSF